MTDDLAAAVEAELAELSRRLTEPGQRECLRCFLLRMISEFGCDGTHRATGLVPRLQRRGGCCCDCEVVCNVFPEYPATDLILPCAGVLRAGSVAPCDLRRLRRSA
jgi:hypothetical protein